MGSIMLNGQNELALGYSISSSTLLPGIRYCGQSSAAYDLATGAFDVPEEVIQDGVFYQTGINRWGDYASMQVDPAGDSTFWFTSEYIGVGGARKTKIASFEILLPSLTANFQASNITPPVNSVVFFTDQSLGSPNSWTWAISPGTFNYTGGTSSSSQNPQVLFTTAGSYTVTLTVSNGEQTDSEIKTNYINVQNCSNVMLPFSEDFSDGVLPDCWSNIDNIGNGQVWLFNNPGGVVLNSTTGTNGFAVLDSDYYGSGSSQNADLISPEIDFSYYETVNITFQHDFVGYVGSSGTLSYTINGGSSWVTVQTWANTGGTTTFSQDMTSPWAGQPSVRVRWKYIGTWGYNWAIDDISITGTGPNLWTGTYSNIWNEPANWSNGVVPGSTEPANIPSSSTNWPVFAGNLTIGTDCGDITLFNGAHMSVTGNLTIGEGSSLTFNGSGQIDISGNWIRYGTFNPGQGTVSFSGTETSEIIIPVNVTELGDYTLSTFPKNMTLLSGITNTGPIGDNGNSVAQLEFTFNYLGTDYTQVRLSTNGWLSLNSSGTTQTANLNLFTTSIPNTTIAPWFDDLNVDGSATLKYKTEGTEPNRVFTAEWKTVLTYKNQATSRISFQVKLFENSSAIEFHYGTFTPGSHNGSESASIGIEDVTGGSGHFIEATTGSMVTGVTNLVSTTNWPNVNYRFSLPVATEEFNNLIINKSNSYVECNLNITVNGNLTVSPNASFNVRTGKMLIIMGTAF
jgi:PKD repeat protein